MTLQKDYFVAFHWQQCYAISPVWMLVDLVSSEGEIVIELGLPLHFEAIPPAFEG